MKDSCRDHKEPPGEVRHATGAAGECGIASAPILLASNPHLQWGIRAMEDGSVLSAKSLER